MNSFRLKYEGWLYGLAFLIALGFRLIQLGAAPLTDSEASLAGQALRIAQGARPLLEPQPAYILLTSVLFTIIESTNFLARLVPAMAGSVLVFIPYLFREKLKPMPALVLAFLFAIDPGLVALSRLAGGTILAVSFSLLAWGFWIHRRLVPAGILAGLALLSGPSLWMGLVTFGLVWLFLQGLEARPASNRSSNSASPDSEPSLLTPPAPITSYQLRIPILALLTTLILVGTLFFLVPNGLSAWVASLPAYLGGWMAASIMTPGRMLFALVAYEPLGLFFAALSLIRGYRTGSRRTIRLSLWLGVSLLLAVFYRQPGELAWAIVPLLALASMEISRIFNLFPAERLEVGVVSTALLILLAYIWFDIAAIGLDPFNQFVTSVPVLGSIQNPRYAILYGATGILVLCILFVAFGWSTRTAWLGSGWAFLVFLGIYSLGAAWGGSGLRNPNGVELWTVDPRPVQADLLLKTVRDVSKLSVGHERSQPVTLVGIDSPALEWLLRGHPVERASLLDPQSVPPILITRPMDDLSLSAAYRGQDFTWRQRVQYESLQRPEWWRWLANRQLPRENETLILWARDDLFPDARQNFE